MNTLDQIKTPLTNVFSPRHIGTMLKYYEEAVQKYQRGDWDGVSLKGGKFVESITKALAAYCSVSLPTERHFKAGNILKSLEQLSSVAFDDVVRIVIPKACLLIYEIVNNRGGRHDSDNIDPNSTDSEVIMPVMSWTLAELFRFASKGNDPVEAKMLIESLTKRMYPHFEEIDGRPYINIDDLSASSIALLILYYKYPMRLLKSDLTEFVGRHGFKPSAVSMGISRISSFVDEENGSIKLRSNGLQECDIILSENKANL